MTGLYTKQKIVIPLLIWSVSLYGKEGDGYLKWIQVYVCSAIMQSLPYISFTPIHSSSVNPKGSLYTTRFNVQKFYILPTQFTYAFCMVVRTNGDYLHITYWLAYTGVPLATEPGISLIILTPMKILERNLNKSTFVVWEMKSNVSVVCVCSAPNCCDTEQRSASQPGSVTSGTHYIYIFKSSRSYISFVHTKPVFLDTYRLLFRE